MENLSVFLNQLQAKFHRRLEHASLSHYWSLYVVLIAVAVSYLSELPQYTAIQEFISTPYGQAKIWWLENPLQAVPVDHFFPLAERHLGYNAGCASHCDKLTFRIALPVLHKIAPFGIWTLVITSHIAAVAIFWMTYKLLFRSSADSVSASLATWALAGTYAGELGFKDFYYGDALAVALLLGAMMTRRRWLIMLLIVVAGFTDERAVIAAPLIALFHYWQSKNPTFGADQQHLKLSDLWIAWPTICGILIYLLMRVFLTKSFGVSSGSSMLATIDILRAHLYSNYPVRILKVFEFLWTAPVLFVLFAVNKQGLFSVNSLIFPMSFSFAAMPALLVWDVDRSLYYLLPGILISLFFWQFSLASLRSFLQLCLIGTLVWVFPGGTILRSIDFYVSSFITFNK
ncbi:hypothetical protein EI77_02536 [Prosthecobacter fusiformis]|uniref:Dolichyl-phosphate-mannose-protein mannosyltransferase n=1 Tax=Prosthecobacter fusiformis TaxID=48464 RepID=A0A4R7RZN3_9BACT|nr:hypothetical protein [Prosthecobacter fusiformis]TDU71412.1 hypothetical protein EI77_02536 [Prosthecobacter fusiformis]